MVISKIKSWFRKTPVKQISDDDFVWKSAHRIADFYRGYPYLFPIPAGLKNAYWEEFVMWDEGYGELNYWCKEHNFFGQWRSDIHRVSKCLGSTMAADGEYVFDELGGGDVIFFAFADSRDYTWFALRWGYVAS